MTFSTPTRLRRALSAPSVDITNVAEGTGHGEYWFVERDSGGGYLGAGPHVINTALNSSVNSTEGVVSWRTEYVHADHLGSTRLVTDEAGLKVSEYKYYPFGTEADTSSGDTRMKFTGHERDSELGLDYMKARYCGASLGRFTSPDPGFDSSVEDPQSWNYYSYVRNRPINAVDPDGQFLHVLGGALLGGAINATIETVRQVSSGGELNFRKIGASGVKGALVGGTAAATGGASLLASAGAVSAANVAGGVIERAVDGDAGTQALSGGAIASDVVEGALGGGLGNKAGKLVKGAVAKSPAQQQALKKADQGLRRVKARSPSRQAPAQKQMAKVQARPEKAGDAASNLTSAAVSTATVGVQEAARKDDEER